MTHPSNEAAAAAGYYALSVQNGSAAFPPEITAENKTIVKTAVCAACAFATGVALVFGYLAARNSGLI